LDIRAGEIFIVHIKASETVGHEQFNARPFIIVSRRLVNFKGNLVVGVPLTTTGADNPMTHPPYRISIPGAEISKDIAFKGEVKDSIALTDQIRALDKGRLESKMGVLSATALAAVGLGLSYLFDLR
jgi:mRNA-degrading endonuclease toxin of MazEF toxin-antitoxin module